MFGGVSCTASPSSPRVSPRLPPPPLSPALTPNRAGNSDVVTPDTDGISLPLTPDTDGIPPPLAPRSAALGRAPFRDPDIDCLSPRWGERWSCSPLSSAPGQFQRPAGRVPWRLLNLRLKDLLGPVTRVKKKKKKKFERPAGRVPWRPPAGGQAGPRGAPRQASRRDDSVNQASRRGD